jgi:two-component system NtrC family sensor kinase
MPNLLPNQLSDDRNTILELQILLATERDERRKVQSELDLRNCALDSAKTHFMIIDVSSSDWIIVYANRAVAASHGYEPEELLGQNPAILVLAEGTQDVLGGLGAAMREGRYTSMELVARRKDHSTFWVGLYMAPIRNTTGTVTHYLAIGADITSRLAQEKEQRKLQEQLHSEMKERERMTIELQLAQKLESVGRLAAGIAHEINTPIQYIGDGVSFLQSAQVDLNKLQIAYRDAFRRLANDETVEAVIPTISEIEITLDQEFLLKEIPLAFERTLEGVERVAGIVRAMKEFAHPDSAEHSSADLNHAIQTTLTVAHNEYKYSAEVESRLSELPLVTCNVGELNQVFLNLIVNASHAIAESGKDVTTGRIVIITSVDKEDVVISIADNGCGIPAANLEKVFDPFFTTKPVGRGTGQGLAIARSIVVEKHGGSMIVQSSVGNGTLFILKLPIAGRPSIRPN